MNRIKIDIYLPLTATDKEEIHSADNLISELLSLSGKILIPLDDFGDSILNIEKTENTNLKEITESFPTYFKSSFYQLIHFKTILNSKEVFHFDLPYDLTEYNIKNIDLNKSMLVSIYISRFINFLIFTQLAIPGSLNSHKGIILKDGEYFEDIKPMSSNLSSLIYEENQIWPKPGILSIYVVWDYIIKRTNILTMKSANNIENGLNAFTYLFNDPINFMQNLLWAMTGVESLYAQGDIGISYQIDKKAKLFLGEPKENKKILKKLYDFRSKFLHGSMNIPINNGWLSQDDEEKYDDEFYQMDCLATKLLTSTLQKIIKLNRQTFEFDFKLIE